MRERGTTRERGRAREGESEGVGERGRGERGVASYASTE